MALVGGGADREWSTVGKVTAGPAGRKSGIAWRWSVRGGLMHEHPAKSEALPPNGKAVRTAALPLCSARLSGGNERILDVLAYLDQAPG